MRRPHRLSRRHVAETVKESPARAEPHDADAWLPVPDVDSLPELDDLIRAWSDPAGQTHPAESRQSPARSRPHDPTAWLPLPDTDALPSVEDLLTREPWTARPSPARAEPHDANSWLPLPVDLDALPGIRELVGHPVAPPPTATTRLRPAPADSAPPPSRPATPVATSRRRIRLRRSWVVLAALVAATVVGGVYALPNVVDQGIPVELRVDGRLVSADTGVATVGAFLREQHVDVGPHDRVVPSVTAKLSEGLRVNVVRGFPVTRDLDGVSEVTWTTYQSSAEFLQKDLRLGDRVVLRAGPKKLQEGSTVVLRTKHQGTLLVDGQTVAYDAPAHDLDELLAAYSVQLGAEDYVTKDGVYTTLDVPITDGSTFQIMRIGHTEVSHNEPYQVPDETKPDPNLDVRATRTSPGAAGVLRVTEEQTLQNDVPIRTTILSKVPTVLAKPTVHYYGTKADPIWDRIATCETGRNWAMQGPLWSGGLGIYNGTWDAYGGRKYASNAGLASREEQIIVAMEIRRKVGLSGWGCARKMGLR